MEPGLPPAMDTVELVVRGSAADRDLLVADLLDLGFEAFEETDRDLKAYMPADAWTRSPVEALSDLAAKHRLAASDLVTSRIPAQNWNATWEASLRPIKVGRFLIKPSWCPVPEDAEEIEVLEIDPKMSFGTGYHETTRLMLWLMEETLRPGQVVLDAGTGTGILAIAAVRLGAARVVAFDIDPWAEINAEENLVRNDAQQHVEVRIGDIEVVPEAGYQVILANIQLNTLIAYLPDFDVRLACGGALILGGILLRDRGVLMEAAAAAGYVAVDEAQEGEWWSVVLQRAGSPGAGETPVRSLG